MKIKGLAFEIYEYTFDKIPEGGPDKYKSKTKLLDIYKDVGEKLFDSKLKLFEEVRKNSNQDVFLVTVRDQAKDTLNLVVTT